MKSQSEWREPPKGGNKSPPRWWQRWGRANFYEKIGGGSNPGGCCRFVGYMDCMVMWLCGWCGSNNYVG